MCLHGKILEYFAISSRQTIALLNGMLIQAPMDNKQSSEPPDPTRQTLLEQDDKMLFGALNSSGYTFPRLEHTPSLREWRD